MQSTRQAAEGGHVTATEEETSGSSSAAAAAQKELPPPQPASGSTSALRSHPSLNLQRRRPHIEGSLTIREPSAHRMAQLGQSRRRDGALSRATMVHGTQQPNDMWYDAENFLLDQVKEVLNKLTEGAIDDEIWGKIVIMERCRRVAKAYLRKTTVIVDGSEDEFDGKTLGFNHFDNPQRDEHTNEIRAKINDGVILKMDYQGNIKGMARGATPIICQGWRDTRNNCVSDRLVRQQGRLNNPPGDEEKAYKMFDMRRFKHALEREMHEETPDARSLLLKTCVRVALVKDGADMVRTPCWFAVVNLVALDMLKEKIPALRSLISRDPQLQNSNNNNVSATETLNAQALTQIIAAAVSQVQKGSIQSLPVSPEQIAQLASTLTLTQQQQQQQQPSKAEISTINKKDRLRKSYHCSTSSLDSSGEDSAVKSEDSGKGIRAKRWEPSVKSTAAVFENNDSRQEVKLQRIQGANRPRLQDVLFTRSQSITSDYDSNREQFDSGSWSSTQSRYQGGRSTSSSVVSEPELAVLPPKEPAKEAPPDVDSSEGQLDGGSVLQCEGTSSPSTTAIRPISPISSAPPQSAATATVTTPIRQPTPPPAINQQQAATTICQRTPTSSPAAMRARATSAEPLSTGQRASLPATIAVGPIPSAAVAAATATATSAPSPTTRPATTALKSTHPRLPAVAAASNSPPRQSPLFQNRQTSVGKRSLSCAPLGTPIIRGRSPSATSQQTRKPISAGTTVSATTRVLCNQQQQQRDRPPTTQPQQRPYAPIAKWIQVQPKSYTPAGSVAPAQMSKPRPSVPPKPLNVSFSPNATPSSHSSSHAGSYRAATAMAAARTKPAATPSLNSISKNRQWCD